MQTAYQLCTKGRAHDTFDVIVRTRPDALLAWRAAADSVTRMKERFAQGRQNLVAGCVRPRSLVGGDFSDVAFVGTQEFWELFARNFDVYSQYDKLHSRHCVKFQKGQVNDMTGKHSQCCQRRDCAELFAELSQTCAEGLAPPCSFSPEVFFRTWINENNVEVLPMRAGSVNIRDGAGRSIGVCTPK